MKRIEILCSDYMAEKISQVVADNMSPDTLVKFQLDCVGDLGDIKKGENLYPSEDLYLDANSISNAAKRLCAGCFNLSNISGLQGCIFGCSPVNEDGRVYCRSYKGRVQE